LGDAPSEGERADSARPAAPAVQPGMQRRAVDPAVEPAVQPGAGVPAVQAPIGGGPIRKEFAVSGAVGRLGTVISDKTPIYRERGRQPQPLFRVDRDGNLVITRQVDNWFGVMMVDGSVGWVEAQFVKLTDTELVYGESQGGVPQPGTGAGSATGVAIIQAAYRYLGVPYVWGGNGFRGIDCSGLVQQAYLTQGIRLPRVSRDQFRVGTPVNWNQLQAGDRIYFASDGGRIDHTGMYIGNGQFIHASGRRDMVCIDDLTNPRYWSMFVGAKR
jgi:cell wall-associated NlpC family hydrolase